MLDLIHSKQVSASQIPVISFAARDLLLHDHPSFEKWAQSYFQVESKKNISEKEVRAAVLKVSRQLNERARDASFKDNGRYDLLSMLVAQFLPESSQQEAVQKAWDVYRAGTKVSLPESVFDILATLKERSYRLALVSNEGSALVEILKLYQMFDFFDCVQMGEETKLLKPDAQVFEGLLEELDVLKHQIIHVGDRYATDVLACERAGVSCILYDPQQIELLALNREETSGQKVVSLDVLRKNRALQNVKVITKLEELLEFFR